MKGETLISALIVTLPWTAASALLHCDSIAKRFSTQHTLCLPVNTNCNLHTTGIDAGTKRTILDLHNSYRSVLANGEQRGMPSASNMMELEWDNDLAAVAQAHANHCVMQHDCNECRAIDKFPSVGQNICQMDTNGIGATNYWQWCIKNWFDEAKHFPASLRKKFEDTASPTGHFTQMVWATTWKVGCGFASFSTLGKTGHTTYLQTCNYGPSGNVLGMMMYSTGKPCSQCPGGTCCNEQCKKYGIVSNFDGLCKSTTPNGPAPTVDEKNLLWACFRGTTKICAFRRNPPGRFLVKRYFSSVIFESVLKPGEKGTITFANVINEKNTDVKTFRQELKLKERGVGQQITYRVSLKLPRPIQRAGAARMLVKRWVSKQATRPSFASKCCII
ncbi:CRISP/Allergen/PR-1-like [Ornithodoros turicata]|uniref:CRISP/Allergen/PR-1-like n=1 Tax=Ornithodoros turicata TaxID=34597 RepID=UPI003139BFDB